MEGMQYGAVQFDPPLVLAPMAGVTDRYFRLILRRLGGVGLVTMEFISSEAVTRGNRRTLRMMHYAEEERPLSIQIYGSDPDRMAEAARVVEGIGADVCDINMGCPGAIARHWDSRSRQPNFWIRPRFILVWTSCPTLLKMLCVRLILKAILRSPVCYNGVSVPKLNALVRITDHRQICTLCFSFSVPSIVSRSCRQPVSFLTPLIGDYSDATNVWRTECFPCISV